MNRNPLSATAAASSEDCQTLENGTKFPHETFNMCTYTTTVSFTTGTLWVRTISKSQVSEFGSLKSNLNITPLLMKGVFLCAVIMDWTPSTNSFNASAIVMLRRLRSVWVSSSSAQHGRLTSSPPELIIVPGSTEATESKSVRAKESVDREAMRSWPAGGSDAYVDQGDLDAQAMCSGYAAPIAVV